MRNIFIIKVVGLSLLAAAFVNPAQATHRCEDYGLKPVDLFADGQIAAAFVVKQRAASGGVSEFLEKLGITNLDEGQVADLLQAMNDYPAKKTPLPYPVPASLKGIGGSATRLLLEKLIFVRGRAISDKVFYGKIRDYTYIDKTKSGHLSIDTCIDDRQAGTRVLYHWDIEVAEKGFKVKSRTGDPVPSNTNPFDLPPSFQMPAGALDPQNSHSIWHRGLDHKLGANGTDIKIVNVYSRQLSDRVDSVKTFERIDPSNDPLGVYDINEDSCIDLFTRHYPPATFGQLEGAGYCLGRCTSPAIFNSGD